MSTGLSIEAIYKRRGAFENFLVVFVDVVSYSGRTARIQQEIVSVLTRCLNKALEKTTKEYQRYDPENHGIDFPNGVVKIPTGDGAAIAFSHTGHPYIHLSFALYLLEEIQKSNVRASSEENKFHVRIGIADDTGIIYEDINGNYNLAGRAINMAARVMDVADENEIMFANRAYRKLTENQTQFEEKLKLYGKVRLKNVSDPETVWQYFDESKPFLNNPSSKGRSSMKPTQPDLENALFSIQKSLEQITESLGNRFVFLNGTKQIYGPVAEAINKAKRQIRIVRLGSRPAAPDEVIDALARKVLEEEVTYDIVIVLDPRVPIGGFKDNHKSLKEKFGGHHGADDLYRPYVLETNQPICFDLIIVDNTDVGIGFTHARVEDLQHAIMFHNPDVAGNLVDWFDNVIRRNPGTKPYNEWE